MGWTRLGWTFGLLCACALGGCSSEIPRYVVSGTVTFDGVAVEKGEISFVPVEPGGAPEGGLIENGEYRVEVTAGKKTVEIRASRPLPPEQQDSPEMGLLYEDYIPAQYNRETTLKAEISADGDNEYPFTLTSS